MYVSSFDGAAGIEPDAFTELSSFRNNLRSVSEVYRNKRTLKKTIRIRWRADHLFDRRSKLSLLQGERGLLFGELRCLHGKILLVYFARKLTFCMDQFFWGGQVIMEIALHLL